MRGRWFYASRLGKLEMVLTMNLWAGRLACGW